jgi:hypothetical protein
MKKLLTTLAAVLATLSMYGQGTVSFNNSGAPNSERVWIGAVGTENGGTLAPVGTQYNVALYYDPLVTGGATDAGYVQIGAAAPIGQLGVNPGIFSGGTRTIPVGSGGVVNFQVRGWNTSFGTSYETAGGQVGKSTIFRMDTAVGLETAMGVRGTGTFTTGWTGFAIVPEPSAIALGLIGASALLLLRRRK